ncbi:MAG: membrane protein insertase YidC [Endozoicomonadaceae bacterium]|nr:membrane protein insertase YidC [Endozoicomonadaceae bacterium]
MDFKRTILIIGLLIVGYFIILNWSEDSKNHTAQSTFSTIDTHSTNPSFPTNNHESAVSDVPLSSSHFISNIDTKNIDDTKLINIETDLFTLKINPKGGNITYLALKKYLKQQGKNNAYILLDECKELTYIAQSGWIGNPKISGVDNYIEGAPLYFSSQNTYQLTNDEKTLTIDLHYEKNGISITKRYAFEADNYAIKMTYLIKNNSTKPWIAEMYAQLKRNNCKDPETLDDSGTTSNSFLGAALKTVDSKFKKIGFNDFLSSPMKERVVGGYAAILQHYFEVIWVPEQAESFLYTTREVDSHYLIGLQSHLKQVNPHESLQVDTTLYAGPKIKESLEKLSDGLELTVDYGYLWFIASPMFVVLNFLYQIFGNWGWSILLLTLLIKLLFFPLSAASYRSMARMRSLQPKMIKLKERYVDDKQKMSQELFALYKKEKVNPLGGCLPVLVQMPFFIALYEVLMEAVQLRQAPWIFWIHDLSKMDPYLILPLLMGFLMFVQQQFSPPLPDPTQTKIMKLMPIVFTVFFLWFPAGLVLYWVVNSFLSILQQYWITKQHERMNQQNIKKIKNFN